VVWIPKYRRETLYGELRRYVGSTFRDLALQKECQVIEGHLWLDPIPMRISIPSQYVVSQGVGYRKGQSAMHRARTTVGRKENVTGQRFWARGYFVSTAGAGEEAIRETIWRQECRKIVALTHWACWRDSHLQVAHQSTAWSGSHYQASGFAGGHDSPNWISGAPTPGLLKHKSLPKVL